METTVKTRSRSRSINKLLEIVINSLKEGDKLGYFNNGICGEIIDLHHGLFITHTERCILNKFLEENKPTTIPHNLIWWWPIMKKDPKYRKIRIDFLIQLQKKHK